MQVSIYLKPELVRKLDRLARKGRRSRSEVIQALLESSLAANGGGHRIAALAGRWRDTRSAEEIIAEVYEARARNRRSERAVL